jgi:mannose-6-phosphate isomerase-like protein (cupin superfamily)
VPLIPQAYYLDDWIVTEVVQSALGECRMTTIRPAPHIQPEHPRFDGASGPRIIGPRDGEAVDLRSLGVRFMIWGDESGGSVSLVEHPIPARTLVAPLHRHTREDEYSFVLEGRMGAQLGDDVVHANPGDLVFKPRNQWHTFWNAGDASCRILEIISPAGFERFFDELAVLIAEINAPNPGVALAGSDLPDRYGIAFDPASVPRLCQEHGLVFPGL